MFGWDFSRSAPTPRICWNVLKPCFVFSPFVCFLSFTASHISNKSCQGNVNLCEPSTSVCRNSKPSKKSARRFLSPGLSQILSEATFTRFPVFLHSTSIQMQSPNEVKLSRNSNRCVSNRSHYPPQPPLTSALGPSPTSLQPQGSAVAAKH